MKRIVSLLAIGLGLTSINQVAAQSTVTLDSTVLDVRTIIDGIDIPWEITYGPDGWIWMTERYGRVSRVKPSTGQHDVLLDLSNDVYSQAEAGMLGLALHPDWSNKPWVYIAYTYGSFSNIQEKLVRYTYDGTNLISPVTIIDGIQGNTTHIGCRIMFLPDETFIITTGDAQNTVLPQDVTSLSGKCLRFNDDGTIPADNPWPNSYVYSWGHRNAQGLFYHDGRIYSSEHGPSNDDEFHIIEPSRNYGWPNVEGFCDQGGEQTFCNDSSVVEPLIAWTPTIAPSDIYYYDNPAIPEWENTFLMAVLKDKKLIRLELDAAGTAVTSETHYLTNQFGRLRDITVDPAGCVYLATNGSSWSNTSPFTHEIIRLCPQGLTGLDESALTSVALTAMPNPADASQNITVKSGIALQAADYQLSDLNGRLVLSGNVSGNSFELETADLAAGTYILRMQSAQHVGTLKVVIR